MKKKYFKFLTNNFLFVSGKIYATLYMKIMMKEWLSIILKIMNRGGRRRLKVPEIIYHKYSNRTVNKMKESPDGD